MNTCKLGIATPQGTQAVAERTREGKTEIEPGRLAEIWQSLAEECGLNLGGVVDAAMAASAPRGIVAMVHDWGRALVERASHSFGPKPEPLLGHPPGLHVDSKDTLENEVGKHRGDVTHARDLMRNRGSLPRAKKGIATKKPSAERYSSQDIPLEIKTRTELQKVY
jgi:hypothetical protein